jgi:Tfp pilus assembly protein PilW
MKFFSHQKNKKFGGCQRLAGYTLVEVMIAGTLSVIVVMAIIAAHLIGLRESQWVESKAGADETSRRVLNQLPTDIRAAKMWFIGNMNGTTFTNTINGTLQQGTALQLFSTTNGSTPFVLYYFDLSDAANNNGRLMRLTNFSIPAVVMASNLVNWLSNGYSFSAENYNGIVSTNDGSRAYKNVIHTTLQFCMFEYPLTAVGTNGLYDFYKLEFKATPHLPE